MRRFPRHSPRGVSLPGSSRGALPRSSSPTSPILWWDLRPRPDLGTIEFRVADAQTPVEHCTALVAICQSLIAALRLRYRESGSLPVQPSHVIAENRWRAVRDGLDGELVDPVTGESEPARARIAGLLLELEPFAAELGCSAPSSNAPGRSSSETVPTASASSPPAGGFRGCSAGSPTRPSASARRPRIGSARPIGLHLAVKVASSRVEYLH